MHVNSTNKSYLLPYLGEKLQNFESTVQGRVGGEDHYWKYKNSLPLEGGLIGGKKNINYFYLWILLPEPSVEWLECPQKKSRYVWKVS